MKVVDASIVLGWLLQEQVRPGSAQVLKGHLDGSQQLAAPELLHYEVGNALVTGARLSVELARQAYQHFESLEVQTFSLGGSEYEAAITLAATHRITVYDASYAALARTLGCRLVTADGKLARALKALDLVDLA